MRGAWLTFVAFKDMIINCVAKRPPSTDDVFELLEDWFEGTVRIEGTNISFVDAQGISQDLESIYRRVQGVPKLRREIYNIYVAVEKLNGWRAFKW